MTDTAVVAINERAAEEYFKRGQEAEATGLAEKALERTIAALRCPAVVVSFNDEGYLRRDALEAMLGARGHLQVIEIPHERYVGAKIGIHNPQGVKVGSIGRLTNVEYLFVATERRVELPAPRAA